MAEIDHLSFPPLIKIRLNEKEKNLVIFMLRNNEILVRYK